MLGYHYGNGMSDSKDKRPRRRIAGRPAAKPAGSGTAKAPWQILEAEFKWAAQSTEQLPAQIGVELAFAGRSNVGKSSLMNTLTGRRRLVRTSSTPGCTRAINFFEAKARDGAVFQLVDLPGYGYAKRSKAERNLWAGIIEGYLAERQWLRAVTLLVDARRGFGEADRMLSGFVAARPKKDRPEVIVVATKIDKLPKAKRRAMLRNLSGYEGRIIGVSAVTGEGIEALWQALRKAAHVGDSGDLT
ncbi:MAG: ribosome biogenesis GTP-binding protein YsxC [Deltaproteobacteria bacterium]|nr:MAG: ribosome biogenesis GTP-binding protein YsxC [Deltaproteobacteria bacterium]